MSEYSLTKKGSWLYAVVLSCSIHRGLSFEKRNDGPWSCCTALFFFFWAAGSSVFVYYRNTWVAAKVIPTILRYVCKVFHRSAFLEGCSARVIWISVRSSFDSELHRKKGEEKKRTNNNKQGPPPVWWGEMCSFGSWGKFCERTLYIVLFEKKSDFQVCDPKLSFLETKGNFSLFRNPEENVLSVRYVSLWATHLSCTC